MFLLNLWHKELSQFWKQRGPQTDTSKVYLVMWSVSVVLSMIQSAAFYRRDYQHVPWCIEAYVYRTTISITPTQTETFMFGKEHSLSRLHSLENSWKELLIIFYFSLTLFTILHSVLCSTSSRTTTFHFPLPQLSDIPTSPMLLLSMLFSGLCTHDLQSLNAVLCLQSADETIICHINSPSALLYSHTQPSPV